MKRSIWLLLLGLMLLPLAFGQTAVQAEPEAIDSDPILTGSAPGTAVTNNNNTPQGARGPDIAAAPNGNELLIVYERQLDNQAVNNSSDHDIYYRTSSNNGNSWTAPAAIFTSGSADSIQVRATYANNTAYAVWIERPDGGGNEVLRVRSRGIGGNNWSNVGNGQIASNAQLSDPAMTASGSTVHVVWGERPSAGDFGLKHARRSGGSWIITDVVPVAATILSPSIAVDSSGFIHVVWEEEIFIGATPRTVVKYARGQASGNSTTWSSPLTLSSTNEDYVTPSLNLHPSGELEVAYTRQQASTSPVLQDIYYRSCRANCLNGNNWQAAQPITALHSVNASVPFFLIPSMASDDCGNTYVYYHGGPPGDANEEETIYGVNRVSNWSSSLADDNVSAVNTRSVNPSIAATSGNLHIVYQQIVGTESQLYYRRGLNKLLDFLALYSEVMAKSEQQKAVNGDFLLEAFCFSLSIENRISLYGIN